MFTKSVYRVIIMEIRKTLNESRFYKIESVQQISKNDLLLKDYKQIFDDLVESEVIKNKSIEDNLWFVYDPLSQLNLQMKFDLIGYRKINKHLKFFILLRLISGKTPKTTYDELSALRKVILGSQGFESLAQLLKNINILVITWLVLRRILLIFIEPIIIKKSLIYALVCLNIQKHPEIYLIFKMYLN